MKLSEISLKNASKRFNYKSIFEGISHSFQMNSSYGISGPNGSGKSTLLQCIIGYQKLSNGVVSWLDLNTNIISDRSFLDFYTFTAPYVELIEEYTVREHIELIHRRWPKYWDESLYSSLLHDFRLESQIGDRIVQLSSGQKQKLKLIQALAVKKDVLILDEPTSFLDSAGISVYQQIISHLSDRMVIIASNDDRDFPTGIEMIKL